MRINEKNYVDNAEAAIPRLSKKVNKQGREIPRVTTSKIINLLSMAADIYNQALDCKEDVLPDDITSRIDYLRVRFMYEAGREQGVKSLIEEADLLNIMKEIKGNKNNYILFYHYMEALVAFKRYMNKNDD